MTLLRSPFCVFFIPHESFIGIFPLTHVLWCSSVAPTHCSLARLLGLNANANANVDADD